MHKHAHLPGRIDFRTPTNPHGLRLIEGDGGAPAGGGGGGTGEAGGQGGEQPPAGGNGEQGSQQDPPKPAPPKSGQQGQQGSEQQPEAQRVEDLPEWAQKIIRDTRGEAAGNRTKANEAEQRQQEIVKAIAKAAGIEIPGEGNEPDPEQLTQQLSTTQQQARESAAELVVWRHASDLKVDAAAVTDSRAFERAIKDLDPASETFAEDVKKAATKAAEDNPKLKAARAAGASSVDHAGGSGETPQRPTTLKDAVDAHYRAGR